MKRGLKEQYIIEANLLTYEHFEYGWLVQIASEEITNILIYVWINEDIENRYLVKKKEHKVRWPVFSKVIHTSLRRIRLFPGQAITNFAFGSPCVLYWILVDTKYYESSAL